MISIAGMRESTFGKMISQYAPDELHLFDNLRMFIDDRGNFWFIGSEVASIMGYKNPWDAVLRHVPEQYRLNITRSDASLTLVIPEGQKGGAQSLILIHELGLYALAMRSNLPQAYQFQDWVYRVISRIRQYGGYISPNSNLLQVVDIIPEQYRQAFTNMIDIKNKVIDEQNEVISRQKSSIKFRDGVLDIKDRMMKRQRKQVEDLADLIDLIVKQQQ